MAGAADPPPPAKVGPERPVSSTTGEQQTPAVAFDGTIFLVVWADGGRILGARVRPDGQLLDPTPIAISGPASGARGADVVWNGTEYFVVLADGRIRATRLTKTGVVLDTPAITIATFPLDANDPPAVAWNGSKYLVAWVFDFFELAERKELYATRVSATGAVLEEEPILVGGGCYDQYQPDVASNGTDFLVVFTDQCAVNDEEQFDTRIVATRVTDAGRSAGRRSVGDTPNWQGEPTMAWNDSNYFVAWVDAPFGVDEGDILGARLARDGSLIDTTGKVIAAGSEPVRDTPAVAANGRFLVVWRDLSGGSDIFGARVAGATVEDPGGLPHRSRLE